MRPIAAPDTPVERIRHSLVSLRMPRALEALDEVVQQIERGQISSIEAIDTLLSEELSVREGRRIKAALQMARLATVKTLTGFDFSFQPSLDRNRIMALAGLDFIIGAKSSTSSAKAVPARRISPRRSESRRSAPGAPSISRRWRTSSTAWPKPTARDGCASASGFYAGRSC
jgi:hypothetical protein